MGLRGHNEGMLKCVTSKLIDRMILTISGSQIRPGEAIDVKTIEK